MFRKIIILYVFAFFGFGCSKQNKTKEIEGTWKMIYAEIKQNDSLAVKDLSDTDFIKMISNNHFAFFNQSNSDNNSFYAGAGTYTLDEDNYTETLSFTKVDAIRDHQFSFKVKIDGDTLIQFGREKVESAGIDREIIEKYIRIKTN